MFVLLSIIGVAMIGINMFSTILFIDKNEHNV